MKYLIALYRSLMLARRAYTSLAAIVALFIASYFIPALMDIAYLALLFLILLVLIDFMALYSRRQAITGIRILPERFSNGDINLVQLQFQNKYPFTTRLEVIDELPWRFQIRNQRECTILKPGEERQFNYELLPVERGEYEFGDINAYVKSPLRLVERRYIFPARQIVPVYPSYQWVSKKRLLGVSSRMNEMGSRRLRKLGRSMEFEQIKEYVRGDDYRNVNWNATARKDELMVNSFTDEKSQHIYCLIDKGRNMKMPFEGMTLLDYAINASLMLTHLALSRQDKAGLLTFGTKIENFLPADRKGTQMETILECLYREQTHFLETDFEALYSYVRSKIKGRSLLVMFTNFESIPGFQRQLPYLRQIAKYHLLLVVFFENTELKVLREKKAESLEEIYIKTIADKFAFEKRLIVKELQQHGILTLLTSPREVTVNAINKYLELKERQAT